MTAVSSRLHTRTAREIGAAASVRRHAVGIALGLVVALAAFLRFYDLGAYGVGNTYYAATVKSMLTSWHNFFFAAFEPGGSVSVDKPPVGFWLQAASAYVLGVNGLALALPQALAGTLSIPLLFVLVRRHFGAMAGLVSALVLALMPIAVATDRNNTIDSLLLFTVLLAVWAAVKSVDSGRLRWLLLAAFLIGIGFNIKMWPAFAPVPALYAFYSLGAPHRWWKRGLHLAAASVVLIVVSFSWAVAVDLTPAEARPYVGSSDDNSVMELITGHNGLSRFTSGGGPGGPAAGGPAQPPGGLAPQGRPPVDGARGAVPPDGAPPIPDGRALPPDAGASLGPGGPTAPDAGSSVPFSSETGQPGVLRLFSEPLVDEASWLLPLALLAVPVALLAAVRVWPLTDRHLAIILWLGWLMPEVVYFSYTSGIFHAYYVIMLGPPIAALCGAAAWAFVRLLDRRPCVGGAAMVSAVGLTLAFQAVTVAEYPDYALGVVVAAAVLAAAGLIALFWRSSVPRLAAPALLFASLLVAPAAWSAATALESSPDAGLPHSSPESVDSGRASQTGSLTAEQEAILGYVLANTGSDSYLLATVSAREAAPFILETGRPVLTFGGFSGSDPIVDVDDLAQMTADGDLRFILGSPNLDRQKPDLAGWISENCVTVDPGRPSTRAVLWDCAPLA